MRSTRWLAVFVTIAVAGFAATPAFGAWGGNAVKAGGRWAKKHAPSFATRYEIQCYDGGYHVALCLVTYRGNGSLCDKQIRVAGKHYSIGLKDSTC